ncbi:MAG: SDR family oxidoreductase [Limisphaerales bacterium]
MKTAASHSKTILVTGASTGIGLALARMLRESKHRVMITARGSSLKRFQEAGISESENFLIRTLDVTNGHQRDEVLGEIEERWGGVDVLVNNAGVSYRAVQEHLTDGDEFDQFDVNYFAPMRLIRRVLPHMRQQHFGRIINVSSVGGMMAMPTMSVYSASKFALEGASEGLWYELQPWNIHVSLVQPGFINSNGFEKVRVPEEGQFAQLEVDAAYHAHYEHMGNFISRYMRKARATSESVALKIVKTIDCKRPPLRVPATIDARVFSFLRRILPRRIYHRLLYWSLPKVRRWGKEPGVENPNASREELGDTRLLRKAQGIS